MDEKQIQARGIRFSVVNEGVEVARVYLYILINDLHTAPFGLIEDVFVEEFCRGLGIGNKLLEAVIARAKAEKCYKLLATSRNDGTREEVHGWYKRLGFQAWGTEFRMNL